MELRINVPSHTSAVLCRHRPGLGDVAVSTACSMITERILKMENGKPFDSNLFRKLIHMPVKDSLRSP